MKKILLILATLFVFNATASTFDEGIDYELINPAVKAEMKDGKIEVRELFRYLCPHCYTLEPSIRKWKKANEDSVNFIIHPAVFSNKWKPAAEFHYILEDLGRVEDLGMKLFRDIHDNKTRMETKSHFLSWLKKNGVSEEAVSKYKKNFAISVKTNKAVRNTKKYNLAGVPTIVVNGKYKTSPSQAGSVAKMIDVLDYLLEKAKLENIK